MQNSLSYSLNIGGKLLSFERPCVMGILNATPDSFVPSSRNTTEAEVERRVCQIVEQGGDIIDVGGVSTRPGADEVSEEEEMQRLRLALRVVRRFAPTMPLSVDTFRASVTERIFDEFGPFLVNDVSGGADPDMFPLVARLGLPYVLTHNPMPKQSLSVNSVGEALKELSASLSRLREYGQKDVVIDPGFGFGKSLSENYLFFRHLSAFHALECPVLVGVSRKSMIYRLLDITPEDALTGTTVLHTLALTQGAHLLRVHDVEAAVQVRKMFEAVSQAS